MHEPYLIRRPIHKYRFAVDFPPVDEAPRPAVIRGTAMVAEYKVVVRGYERLCQRHVIAVLRRHIRLIESDAVYINGSLDNLDNIARQTDDALDVGLARIIWIMKHNQVVASNCARTQFVGVFVDKDPFLIRQA